MGLVTFPTIWVAKQLLTAAALNGNFNALANQVNGNLDTNNLADLAVTTAKIAANAVTGPKIAMGSDVWGDLLSRGAASYQRFAAGTSGYILKTLGAGADPAWVDPNTLATFKKFLSVPVVTGGTVATPVSVPGLLPGHRYKIVVNVVQNGGTNPIHKYGFNADTGSNYAWSIVYGYSSGSGGDGAQGVGGIQLHTNYINVGSDALYVSEFMSIPGNNKKIKLTGLGELYDAGVGPLNYSHGGVYSGAIDMTSLEFFTTSGTVTGQIDVYELI